VTPTIEARLARHGERLDAATARYVDERPARPASTDLDEPRDRKSPRRVVVLSAVACVVIVGGVAVALHTVRTHPTVSTRPSIATTTTRVAPVRHVATDGRFVATVLPPGLVPHEQRRFLEPWVDNLVHQHTFVGPDHRLALAITAMTDLKMETPGAHPRVVPATAVQLMNTVGDAPTSTHLTLAGRPALLSRVDDQPSALILSWAVRDDALVQIVSEGAYDAAELERIALGLRAPS
jgi:hypothetical protein